MQKAKLRNVTCLFLFICGGISSFVFVTDSLAEREEKQIFTTWQVFEVDKCASIWLITRFIDKDAIINIIPRGETPTEGISFDMPDAKFKRSFNMSTYETLLQHYELTDPKLIMIGKIVHDVEINTWEKKKYPESRKALETINSLIMNVKDSNEILDKSRRYFDRLYEKIEVEKVSQ